MQKIKILKKFKLLNFIILEIKQIIQLKNYKFLIQINLRLFLLIINNYKGKHDAPITGLHYLDN